MSDEAKPKPPTVPSSTGLYVFAKRNGLWDQTVTALKAGGEEAERAAKSLLVAYQQSLGDSLDESIAAVDLVHSFILGHLAKKLNQYVSEEPVEKQSSVKQASFEAHATGFTASLGTETPSLAVVSRLNKQAVAAGFGRPFRITASGDITCNGEPVDGSVQMTAMAKTAASYPAAVNEKGGDASKVKAALEKAVKALNEANVAGLKFDDRIAKLEKDTYSIFGEYLEFARQEEVQKAREEAQSVTSSLSTPETDERSGQHDGNESITNFDSVTAAAEAVPSDEEILKAARTKSLNEARADLANGRMAPALFDAFVPLWEALHLGSGLSSLKGALVRGEIDQHLYDLGIQLVTELRPDRLAK